MIVLLQFHYSYFYKCYNNAQSPPVGWTPLMVDDLAELEDSLLSENTGGPNR